MKKIFILVAVSLLFYSTAYSAPVDIPNSLRNVEDESKATEENVVNFSIAGEAESLMSRELKFGDNTGGENELEGQFYSGKGALTLDFLGKWDWYGFAGVGEGLKISNSRIGASNLDLEYEDNAFMWGGGVNYLIYTFPEYYGLGVFADAKYRRLENFDTDAVTVNGAASAFTSLEDPEWDEWQVALGLAGKINYIVPFAGATYSDTRIKQTISAGGTTYNIRDVENENLYGAFAGVSIIPNDYFSFDVQGRFIDEEGVSAKLNLKF